MIFTIVRNGFRTLRRDRGALILAFVLPVAFFSIFALVFGGMRSGTSKVDAAVVDQDHSAVSQRLLAALEQEPSLHVLKRPPAQTESGEAAANRSDYTAATAEQAVKDGTVPVAVVIPKGFGANPIAFGPQSSGHATITILDDSSDPIAAQIVNGMLQKVTMTAMPDIMATQGTRYLDRYAGGLTAEQRARMEDNLKRLRSYLARQSQGAAPASGLANGLVAVSIRDVVGGNKRNPMIAFYAAGIGVMFLLFGASSAAGSLIDEAESGALDRIRSTQVSMTSLLLGKMIYCVLLASLQLAIMFLWGAFVFHLELFSHVPGFVVMTVATALAAASFGMVIATLSRTRQQQAAIATLLVLTMSALGGSMFPRFLMPEAMRQIGLFTFNAWAIDGFTKVFWRDQPVSALLPQVAVLVGSALVLFLIARVLARRWEAG